MKSSTRKSKEPSLDPLYVIFEQHLCNFQDPDVDRKAFICGIIVDYLGFLRKKNITVPKPLEQPVIEELANQVNTMLVKKIYGCFSLQDYQKSLKPTMRRRARRNYQKLSAA